MKTKSGWSQDISVENWVDRLCRLKDPAVRGQVASMVLWDFFGHLPEAPASLKMLMSGYDPKTSHTNEQIIQGLVAVGYPADIAVVRANAQRQVVVVKPESMDEDEDPVRMNLGRNLSGDKALLCGVCEQAVDDIRSLIAAGVILSNGTIRENWPPMYTKTNKNGETIERPVKGFNGVVGYTSRAEVQELLDYVMKDDMITSMRRMGIETELSKILAAIGITGEVPEVQEDFDDHETIILPINQEVA